MFKRLIKKLMGVIFDKPLPSLSSQEKNFLSELKADFSKLPVLKIENALLSEAVWINNTNQLRELVLNQDPRLFLRWDVIARTMFVANAPYIFLELKYLKQRSDWASRWRKAIIESSVGHPAIYPLYPASSGNLIHHAYHLAKYEEKTKLKVHAMDYVFEFGAGYGSMCRLFYNLGFHGRYINFDLPAFSALQRYFLKTNGYPVLSLSEFVKSKNGILCLSDIQQLKALNADYTKTGNTLFIGTWSISELPVSLRGPLLSLISDFRAFLIGYKDNFEEINNVEFFKYWKESNGKVDWHNWRIEHIPGNSYLVGACR